MGWKKWTRERMPAADAQMLTDQGVLRFASAAARDAAIPVGDRQPGMVAYTEDTRTYWGWNPAATAWQKFARLFTDARSNLTVNGGWSTVAGKAPQARQHSTELVKWHGRFTNGGAFTPNATQTPVQIPASAAPATDLVFDVPYAGAASGRCIATLLTTGVLRLDNNGAVSIAAGTTFFLDAITYDPLYTGA